ncbi:hypothetical protein QE436_000431 [Pantoea anthophila]|nr:hypothetical protein [Pantoea anthophila]
MLLSVRGHPTGAVTTTKTGVKRSRQGRTRKPHAPPERTECPAHGGERVSRTAKLPLQAKRPGYREGTAPYPCRFPAAGREAAKEAEQSDFFIVNLRDAAGRGGIG